MPGASPLTDRCRAALGAHGHSLDDAQRLIVAKLEDLRGRLLAHESRRSRIARSLPSPLARVAENIAARARVLCFDEFAVSDIVDATILGALLSHGADQSHSGPGRRIR